MQRCRVELYIKSVINFSVRSSEEEETAETLLENIEQGYAPSWIEDLIKRNLKFEDIEIHAYSIGGDEPAPDEELNFDY